MGLFRSDKIIITLDKNNFIPGEIIKGKISLDFKKPVFVKKLTVTLKGFIETQYRGALQTKPNPKGPYNLEVFRYDKNLSYEGEYQSEKLFFEIEIPENIIEQSNIPKKNGTTVGNMINKFNDSIYQNSPLVWCIIVNLDIPKKLDINEIQEITISKN